jgi:transposase InsO family protein
MPIMESMGKKQPRRRRSFTPGFQAESVELCRRGDHSVGQDAKGLRSDRSRGTYGVPLVHAALRREGAACGRRRVARLTRSADPTGRRHGWRHLATVPDPRASTRPDRTVRNVQPDPDDLDARRRGDVTNVPADEGELCLTTVVDIASRRFAGRATADHMRTDPVADTLTAACWHRRPTRPVIFPSDRGSQYTSQQLAALVAEFGVRLSAGHTGQYWGNALAESFFATITRELLDITAWPNRTAPPPPRERARHDESDRPHPADLADHAGPLSRPDRGTHSPDHPHR